MFSYLPHPLRSVPLITLALLCIFASDGFAQTARTEAVAYASPTLSLAADRTVVNVATSDSNLRDSQVQLKAMAISPSGNPIRYHWTASKGQILGSGAIVTWDLSGLSPGYYKASVEIDTGNGEESCQAFSSTTVLVKSLPPVCPNVSINYPEQTALDQPLTFSSTVSKGSGNVAPVYNWTVSAGKITSGQGTNTITVDTTGLAGQVVRASLSIGGYNLDCSTSHAVQLPVPLECRKFDEFPSLTRNDEKARLDNFVIELQNDPTSKAHVIIHPGRKGRASEVQKQRNRIVDYLVNSRGFNAERIVTVVGQPEGDLLIELWTCPHGGVPAKSIASSSR